MGICVDETSGHESCQKSGRYKEITMAVPRDAKIPWLINVCYCELVKNLSTKQCFEGHFLFKNFITSHPTGVISNTIE